MQEQIAYYEKQVAKERDKADQLQDQAYSLRA